MKFKVEISSDIVELFEAPVSVSINKGPGVGIDVAPKPGITVGINRKPPVQIELKAKRSIDGHIMIFDHRSIDLVIMPTENKCIAFAKEVLHEDVYGAQDRLGRFLVRKGLVDASNVKGGSVYGSMEYPIKESIIPGIDNIQAALYGIYKYIVEERRFADAGLDYENDSESHLLEPEAEFSTELGHVPHKANKGGIDTRVRPFGYQYNYSLIREEEDKG
jgi:hypothetical protein